MMQSQTQSKNLLQRIINRSKDILFLPPFIPFWKRRLQGKAMIYLYHRIDTGNKHNFLTQGGSPTISVEEFTRDIQFLKKVGARFIRFDELVECDYVSDSFYVVLTVDDGFASDYIKGIEAADRESVPLTLFQCSAMMKGKPLIWEHALYYCYFHPQYGAEFKQRSDRLGKSLEAIREHVHPKIIEQFINDFIQDNASLIDEMQQVATELYPTSEMLQSAKEQHQIGSHGNSHYKRSVISSDEFESELETSVAELQSHLNEPVNAFSYPFNSYEDTDPLKCSKFVKFVATVDGGAIDADTALLSIPRNTWPGAAKNTLRHKRWLLTGSI